MEDILKKYGPMLSGELKELLIEKYSISSEAARKRISRAKVDGRLITLQNSINKRKLYFSVPNMKYFNLWRCR
ncbi:hypothetical protein DFR79_104130 [Halanaerobium saccharolyticum]|uniref:Uncharacterized protein n=1 Tax=Halanaerobium saccharolyticum TaxID=43595 RepID=A0A4R6LZD3_9FIRM|nr:hypothetical protein [Halanaerobium saccharolyticum]TDO94164.1 hypothetical protein DFR79_104130 [Halanaerobium saccharolyticum]